jgi:hypothetical protein
MAEMHPMSSKGSRIDRHSRQHACYLTSRHCEGTADRQPAVIGALSRRTASIRPAGLFYKHGLGYALEMANRRQALYRIEDSPVGLAAWILDHDASSYAVMARVFDGPPAGLTRDHLLYKITLYWLTNMAISSVRLYGENILAFFDV